MGVSVGVTVGVDVGTDVVGRDVTVFAWVDACEDDVELAAKEVPAVVFN